MDGRATEYTGARVAGGGSRGRAWVTDKSTSSSVGSPPANTPGEEVPAGVGAGAGEEEELDTSLDMARYWNLG